MSFALAESDNIQKGNRIMLPRRLCKVACALSLVLSHSLSSAAIIQEDFESFVDLSIIDTQLTGLTFQNAVVLTAGVSLNEFEFPPNSGSNVVFDPNGAISIFFDTPVNAFSAYFTYLVPLTLQAFDASSNLLATDISDFVTNLALSGDPGSAPNELLTVSSSGIAAVFILGDAAGGSFVMDDMTVMFANSDNGNTVPEPGTLPLLLFAALVAAIVTRGRRAYLRF